MHKGLCIDQTVDFKMDDRDGTFLTYFDTNMNGNSKSQVDSKGETDDPNSIGTDLMVILK